MPQGVAAGCKPVAFGHGRFDSYPAHSIINRRTTIVATRTHDYLNLADMDQQTVLEEWYAAVNKIVTRLALVNDEFTADDVWEKLPDDLRGMADPRSLGPILKRMEKAKVIKATKRYVPSRRRRGAPVRVWKSATR